MLHRPRTDITEQPWQDLNHSLPRLIQLRLESLPLEKQYIRGSFFSPCWNRYSNATSAAFEVVVDARLMGFDHLLYG